MYQGFVSSTSPTTLILYLTVMSCGTPIVYFMGIEENRQRAQDYFRSNMRIFVPSSRVSPALRMLATGVMLMTTNFNIKSQFWHGLDSGHHVV